MRPFVVAWLLLLPVLAEATGEYRGLDYQITLNLERSALDGRTFGEQPEEDRLVIEEYELELALEYEVSDNFYLFFVGTLIDDSETLETAGIDEEDRGLELNQLGFGYLFGETVVSELNLGRLEFLSASEWWIWWDEELDALRLQSSYANFDSMLALAEPQAPALTDQDDIDAEEEGLRRSFLTLAWSARADQSLIFYYLDQQDRSSGYRAGEIEDIDRLDEEDADLTWIGIGYLAEFDLGAAGELAVELHAARVDGDETVYGFGETDGQAEVEEIERRDVEGSAEGILASWTPAQLDEWTLILGHARGSGDSNPDDGRDESFRQTGLQGDSESFGELYQPELSNLSIDIIGLAWEFSDGIELALISYDYEQRERAEEMRDVSIEIDTTGESRDLGREIDLVLTVNARPGMELILTLAEFDPGKAYGEFSNRTSNFVKFELDYEF